MPNQLTQDFLYSTGKFLDTEFEHPAEREILLADYDRPVFKIVKTNTEHTITQKYINAGKLVLEGFFRISVFYQPPAGGNLTVITKKIPFQKQFDIQPSVHPPYFISVDGEPQYTNTRAINPTRIDVRGVYRITVKAYCRQQTAVATAINSTTVCTDNEEIPHFCLCGRGLKQFSAEEEISVSQEPEKFLNISARNSNMTVDVYQDKVNVKGEIVADIVYTVQDSPDIHYQVKRLPYSQIIEVSGVAENNVAYAEFTTVSVTVTQNPDTKKINCIVTAQLDVKAFRQSGIIAVSDAFSRTFNYDKNRKDVIYDGNIYAVNKNLQVTLEDSLDSSYRPVYSFTSASTPFISTAEGVNTLKSRVTVSVMVKNSQGEYECFSRTEEVIVNIGTDINPLDEYVLDVTVSDTAVSITGETMKASLSLTVTGFILSRKQMPVITAFEENTDSPVEKAEDVLVLYYGKKGEKIFDIALRYKTDITGIIKENNLDSKDLPEDRMLFIPVFGQ